MRYVIVWEDDKDPDKAETILFNEDSLDIPEVLTKVEDAIWGREGVAAAERLYTTDIIKSIKVTLEFETKEANKDPDKGGRQQPGDLHT